MASNYPSPPASPKALDELLICAVCLESYRQPKTLGCLHSFCSECLEKCRRPYRRDITCPVCKKVTLLPSHGVQGLQNDFRIQQIRDILLNISPTPSSPCQSSANGDENPAAGGSKFCGFCEAQQLSVPAFFHCIQCCMCFCEACNDRHSQNLIFASHHVMHLAESHALEVLFCRSHKEHQVKYFCTTCKQMLCTICTMGHDACHKPEPLERGIIEKYRNELQDSLKAIHSKLYEVKNKTKYLETIRETHQRALYEAQVAIRAKTEAIICKVRKRERELLEDVQKKIDERMKGMETLGDIKFYKTSIEELCTEIQNVIVGSPQKCLLAYDDIKAKVQAIPETSLQLEISKESQSVLKFVPHSQEIQILIGTLQEFSVSESNAQRSRGRHSELSLSTSDDSETLRRDDETGHVAAYRHAPYSPKSKKRSASIMHALSPTKRGEVKMGRLKGEKTNHVQTRGGKINADEVLGSSSSSKASSTAMLLHQPHADNASHCSHDDQRPSTSRAAEAASPQNDPDRSSSGVVASPSQPCASATTQTVLPCQVQSKQLYVVDSIGDWPGRLSNPTSATFLPTGDVVVSEDSRLQMFNGRGKSVNIFGWGKARPQSVAVTENGDLVVADRKNCCIKIFHPDGEMIASWGEKAFENGMPSGLAVSKCGNIIATDAQRHMVLIFTPNGEELAAFGAWGSGNYQFNNPLYVSTDDNDNIFIADLGNFCVKVFNNIGNFRYKFSIIANDPNAPIKPQGIAVLHNQFILVCDRENHRIVQFDINGKFIKYLLSKTDGVKFPCDIQFSHNHNLLAVVENHSGFLSLDPHHAVRVFQLKFD